MLRVLSHSRTPRPLTTHHTQVVGDRSGAGSSNNRCAPAAAALHCSALGTGICTALAAVPDSATSSCARSGGAVEVRSEETPARACHCDALGVRPITTGPCVCTVRTSSVAPSAGPTRRGRVSRPRVVVRLARGDRRAVGAPGRRAETATCSRSSKASCRPSSIPDSMIASRDALS